MLSKQSKKQINRLNKITSNNDFKASLMIFTVREAQRLFSASLITRKQEQTMTTKIQIPLSYKLKQTLKASMNLVSNTYQYPVHTRQYKVQGLLH